MQQIFKNNLTTAAVVVLYNPTLGILDNIASYIENVDIVFAVDNSDDKQLDILDALSKIDKLKYIDNGGNKGIAHALNVGAQYAIEHGAKWLLTMDQDSHASQDMISEMFKCVDLYTHIGIISPVHITFKDVEFISDSHFSIVDFVMTSGNLLNLQVYKQVGKFMEELFIDSVDNEFCLRLRENGFLIIQANRAFLKHNLGNMTRHGRFLVSNHSALRRYYIARNRFYVCNIYANKFRHFCAAEKYFLFVELCKIILFENNKIAKLKMSYLGYRDFKANKMGKLSKS